MSDLLADLDGRIYDKAKNAFNAMREDKELKNLGVDNIAVSETRRDLSVQMAYYSRGRCPVEIVQEFYKAAGLYKISEAEAKIKNTWTLKSKHLDGLAIDIVPVKNGSVWWSAPEDVWQRMGAIGRSKGLTWGGDWQEKDYPHYEV